MLYIRINVRDVWYLCVIYIYRNEELDEEIIDFTLMKDGKVLPLSDLTAIEYNSILNVCYTAVAEEKQNPQQ